MIRHGLIIIISMFIILTGCSSNASNPEGSASLAGEAGQNPSASEEAVNSDSDGLSVATEDPTVDAEGTETIAEHAAEATGATLEQLIPEGWGILPDVEYAKVHGDLNEDGIEDIAVVLEELVSSTDSAPLRTLLLALGASNETFTQSLLVSNLVYSSDEGGVFGDPFASLRIEDSAVIVEHYGGSNWRWSDYYQIRHHNNDWYLVGYASSSENIMSFTSETVEYNLETGEIVITQLDEDGNESEQHLQVDADQSIPLEFLDREQFQSDVMNYTLE